jgi:hypothetical protein
MEPFELHPDFYNRPIRLNEEEKADPQDVLRSFFINNPLSAIRQALWKMVEACVGTPNEMAFETGELRENLLLFYAQLEQALEAALLLSEQYPQRRKPNPDANS